MKLQITKEELDKVLSMPRKVSAETSDVPGCCGAATAYDFRAELCVKPSEDYDWRWLNDAQRRLREERYERGIAVEDSFEDILTDLVSTHHPVGSGHFVFSDAVIGGDIDMIGPRHFVAWLHYYCDLDVYEGPTTKNHNTGSLCQTWIVPNHKAEEEYDAYEIPDDHF